MAVTTPLGIGIAPNLKKVLIGGSNNTNNTTPNLKQFLGHKVIFSRYRRSSSLCCRCSSISHDCDSDRNSSSSSSNSVWDWNRWVRHFSEIEQAESFSSVLKFQLEEAVEREDFQEAVKLKSAIAEATSKDTVAEIMSELKKAIEEERYDDASRLSRSTGSGLVGWWIGSAKDSDDPFGRLVRITPAVGKFIGRSYTPRQLVTGSPGTTLFEIYVVKDTDDTYIMQVVYVHKIKGTSTNSTDLQPKPTRDSPSAKPEDSPVEDVQATNKKPEKQEEKVLNIEGATEEGIKSVINFLKDKIPGLNVKVINISIGEKVIEDDAVKQLAQEDSEDATEDSDDEVDDLDEVESEIDKATVEGNGDSMEDGEDLDTKVFVGGILHNEDDATSKEYIRLPGQIGDAEKDSFVLHIPAIRRIDKRFASIAPLAAKRISERISELMPTDVAKALLGNDKLSRKSRNLSEVVKNAVRKGLHSSHPTEYTKFSRITIPRGKTDPFDGLYVGAFGPYGTEIVQLKRKFGHWNTGSELDNPSDVEFFEYVEAIKLTGDLNIPAGQVTFRAKIGRANRLSSRGMYPDELGVVASYKGQGRIAEVGFKNPRWVEGELLQLNLKGIGPFFQGAELGFLYIVPPKNSFLVLFNRINLPE